MSVLRSSIFLVAIVFDITAVTLALFVLKPLRVRVLSLGSLATAVASAVMRPVTGSSSPSARNSPARPALRSRHPRRVWVYLGRARQGGTPCLVWATKSCLSSS